MELFFEDYLSLMRGLHEDTRRTFRDLPQEVLDWVPAPQINSFCVLVTHITGAERYWIGDVAGEEPSGRVRKEEFQTTGLDAPALEKRLSDSLDYVSGILENLTSLSLEQLRTSPRDGRKVTVGWALTHALEHTALHVGHMQMLRQWWDQQQEKPG
jgi:uncharacterized damage-inducible protein DinB